MCTDLPAVCTDLPSKTSGGRCSSASRPSAAPARLLPPTLPSLPSARTSSRLCLCALKTGLPLGPEQAGERGPRGWRKAGGPPLGRWVKGFKAGAGSRFQKHGVVTFHRSSELSRVLTSRRNSLTPAPARPCLGGCWPAHPVPCARPSSVSLSPSAVGPSCPRVSASPAQLPPDPRSLMQRPCVRPTPVACQPWLPGLLIEPVDDLWFGAFYSPRKIPLGYFFQPTGFH